MATKSDRGVGELAQNGCAFVFWFIAIGFLLLSLWFFGCTDVGKKLDKMETESLKRQTEYLKKSY